jgi:hypothetical protein
MMQFSRWIEERFHPLRKGRNVRADHMHFIPSSLNNTQDLIIPSPMPNPSSSHPALHREVFSVALRLRRRVEEQQPPPPFERLSLQGKGGSDQ